MEQKKLWSNNDRTIHNTNNPTNGIIHNILLRNRRNRIRKMVQWSTSLKKIYINPKNEKVR